MSRSQSTPDEPGLRAVALGRLPGARPGSSDGETAGTNGNGRGAGQSPGPADGAVTADGEPAEPVVTGSDIVAAEGGVPPDEITTARMRVPAPAGPPTEELASPGDGAPADAPSGPGAPNPEPPTAHQSVAPASDPAAPAAPAGVDPAGPGPTLDPLPAPAVPAPGPGAAPPPPWRRVPGDAPSGEAEPDDVLSGSVATSTALAAAPVSVTDRLLDDGGPTVFLEAPRSAPASAGATAAEPTEGGSWARVTRTRPPRQAALQLKRLDPWSVLKLALVLAVVLFFIWLVAVAVLYGVLDGMGVWDRLNGTYADLVSGESQGGNTLISATRVFGVAAVVGAINSLLFAVAVTVGAFVYNVSADLVGGIEVTLSERD